MFRADQDIGRAWVAVYRLTCRTAVHDEDAVNTFHKGDVRMSANEDIRPQIAQLRRQPRPGNARIDDVVHGKGTAVDDYEHMSAGQLHVKLIGQTGQVKPGLMA